MSLNLSQNTNISFQADWNEQNPKSPSYIKHKPKNLIEAIKLGNNPALKVEQNEVVIPIASEEEYGVVKLGQNFKLSSTNTLEIKKVQISTLVQESAEDIFFLDCNTWEGD